MQKCTFCNHPSILSLPFCLPPNWPPPCSPSPPAKYIKRKRHKWNKPSSKEPQFLSFRVTHVNRLLAATRETVVTRQTSPQEVTDLHKDTLKDVSPENAPDLAVTIPPSMIRQPWNVAQDQSPKDNNEKTSPWSALWTHGAVCLAKINVSLHCFHWHNAKASNWLAMKRTIIIIVILKASWVHTQLRTMPLSDRSNTVAPTVSLYVYSTLL